MKSMENLYRKFYQKNSNSDKEKDIIGEVDALSVATMKENGYFKSTAVDFIRSISPFASKLDTKNSKLYFENLCKDCGIEWEDEGEEDKSKETHDKLLNIYKDASNDFADEFEECYFDLDVQILSDLVERGFICDKVYEFFKDNSFYGKRIYDRDKVHDYIERVFDKMKSVRKEKSEQEKSKVVEKYKEIKDILGNNYIDAEKISQKQKDGEIALNLLVTEGFMSETVLEVLKQNQTEPNESELKKTVDACSQIKRIYKEIDESPSIGDASDFESTYFAYVKRFMERNSLHIITFDDECQILKEMLKEIADAGHSADLYIRNNGLNAISPVSLEPWRDNSKYLSIVLSNISDNNLHKNKGKEIDAEDMFIDYFAALKNISDSLLSTEKSMEYKYILVVREMLINHISEQVIKETLQSTAKISDKVQLELMIDKTKNMLKKEWELKNTSAKSKFTPMILRNRSVKELKKEGLTVLDIYKIVLERKIYDMPSISDRLYESFVDLDMAESCLKQYRDFDRDELKEIINGSPRAILLSNLDVVEAKDYAESVIQKAEKRLEKAYKIQNEKDRMESAFNQEGDITKQGIESSEKLEYPYQYSKSALKLLLLGYDDLSVRNIVSDMAIKYNMKDPESLTNDVLTSAKKIYNRMMNIKNYDGSSGDRRDAQEEYMRIMHIKYLANNSLKPSMDIDVIAEMTLNKFAKQDIVLAVSKHSPFAIEMGRNEKYVTNYLVPQADGKIVTAQKNIAKTKPIVKSEVKEDILEEYRDLQERYKKEHPIIPYNMRMEELVVASLAMEKFGLDKIQVLLDAHSPFKDSQKNYGESMANRIANNFLSKSI
ncbi:MAG: hypothetical protein IKN12_02715 [Selenomonadaceae bacterium]|nr:hypothetical protein [Selenomonadaceae bacterium]